MKKKSADLISRVVQYMKDNPTIAAWINLVVSIIIAVLIVLILLKIERKITRKWIDKHDGINARFTEKVIRCVIIFLAVLWVIMSNSLTQSFGSSVFQGTAVLAAIAGFAAKPILSDMFCGFMISTTKPFNIGDRIELDDGTAGIVKDITIRHVVLQGIDTLKIVIPNSEINSRRITNLSHMTKTRSIHFRYVDQRKPLVPAPGRGGLFSRLFPGLHGQRPADGHHRILRAHLADGSREGRYQFPGQAGAGSGRYRDPVQLRECDQRGKLIF